MPFRILSILRTSRAKVEITEKVRLPCAMVFAIRHVRLAALDIDMDPLMVAAGFGECVDALLCDDQPVADPQLLTDQRLHRLRTLDDSFCHDILPQTQTSTHPVLSQRGW